MQKIVLSLFLAFLLLFCFSQGNDNKNFQALLAGFKEAETLYHEAEGLAVRSEKNESLNAAADAQYKKALTAYSHLLPTLTQFGYDSLSFICTFRSGVIYHYFENEDTAKQFYLAALQYQGRIRMNDSVFFKPLIYTGAIYFSESKLDSALLYLKKAEAINERFNNNLDEAQRLYNLSGVINFQTGNYQQAENYFEKALALLQTLHSPETSLMTSYQINIGLTLVKLEEYDKARHIYEKLLQGDFYSNEVYHNLGFVQLNQNNFEAALGNFRKVNYIDNKKIIDLYTNMAMAFQGLDKKDSAEQYLLKAKAENLKWNGHQKNISNGLILKFEAEQLSQQGQLQKAAETYQQAIKQFETDFTDDSLKSNPVEFTGAFSYINLFQTLSGKAATLEKLFAEKNDIRQLQAALSAYHSAFKLADYVEKTYNTDEARLFLGRIKYTVHNNPISISLQLYTLTKDKKYLESAYFFDQQNKASILSVNISENEIRNNLGSGNPLIQQEAAIRSTISRLSLQAATIIDSTQLSALQTAIRDNELELEKVQEKIYADPDWQQKRAAEQIPTITELQKKLDNTTALLSYHLAEKEIVVFLVSANQFDYFISPASPAFYFELDSFKSVLHNINTEHKYTGAEMAHNLYQRLLAPVRSNLAQKKRLIIIPDDELNYLPFEALQDDNNKYLIESFSVQYQYSTALLGKKKPPVEANGTLAFAPFVKTGYSDSTGNNFSALPASRDEVQELKGKTYYDSGATKANFLANINKYDFIHLATHASVNNQSPNQSFITFFPDGKENKLYAQEIYNLRLDSTQLIILSACETGTGKLIRGEGLLSLSRAFAYAGCPNIVTSLWKAEDKTTAFLTRQFHLYLDKGYTKDKALQQAKLDLLKDETIDPRFKSPNYWANFIFIGHYQPGAIPSHWWWIAGSLVVAALLYIFFSYYKKRKARS